MSPLRLVFVALALTISSSTAAIFPKSSNVQHINAKGFREAMKRNMTFVVAFVAPWCGHCQKLAPELIKTADGLHPLVPVYAVDCDDDKNKPLCGEQGVKGFPTIKIYHVGENKPPIEYDGMRTASSIYYWAAGRVPGKLSRSQNAKGISEFITKNSGKPKAVLMNKSNKMPLLWRVLSNKYGNQIAFASCRDRQGKVSVELGFEAEAQSKNKILIYGPDDTLPVLYEGAMKFAALSKFFEQVIDGTADISRANIDAKQKVLNTPETESGNLEDETRIGDTGHHGFSPHGGMDIEELMRLGIPNPHGAGHPGAKVHAGSSERSTKSSISEKQPTETKISQSTEEREVTESRSASPTDPPVSPENHAKVEL